MLTYAFCLWFAAPALAAPGAPRTAPRQASKAAPKAAPAKRPAGVRKGAPPPARRAIRLGPMLFHVTGGKVKTIEQLQLPELFRIASKMYQQKKYPTAIKLYRRIVRFFPKHKHRYAALYNLALALEDSGQLKRAIYRYQQMIQESPKRKANVLNARFRMAACFNRLKKWSSAFQIYGALLQTNLSVADRVDALAYAGRALFHMAKYVEALPLLRLAVLTHTRQPNVQISYAAAMAQYYRGFTHDKLFRLRKFHLPQMRLKQDLDYKSEQMLKAQKLYFQTIKLRHADWALAALFRIGEMYEQMYKDMMTAPVPKDLSKREILIYKQLLRNKIKVLLTKALLAYRMNLRLAGVIGLKSHRWKSRSDKRFQELTTFYKKWFGKAPKILQHPAVKGTKPAARAGGQPTSRPAGRAPAPKAGAPAPKAPKTGTPKPKAPAVVAPRRPAPTKPAPRRVVVPRRAVPARKQAEPRKKAPTTRRPTARPAARAVKRPAARPAKRRAPAARTNK